MARCLLFPVLFYLLRSHLRPLLFFPRFCRLLFLSSVPISPLFALHPADPLKPSFCAHPLLLVSSPLTIYFLRLSSQLLSPASVLYTSPPLISCRVVINIDREDVIQASSLSPFYITYVRLTYLGKSIMPRSISIIIHNIDILHKSSVIKLITSLLLRESVDHSSSEMPDRVFVCPHVWFFITQQTRITTSAPGTILCTFIKIKKTTKKQKGVSHR